MALSFANKVVLVTGAGKGLGRAFALDLAARGAQLVINNRRHPGEEKSSADNVVAEIVAGGGQAVAEYSSIEDTGAGDKILQRALDSFGRLDCAIANAGVSENSTFRKQTVDDFRKIIDINLLGTVNVLHPVFRHLCSAQQGNIVICTSTAGLFGSFGLPAYSASKAALVGLTLALSQEGAPKNVRVNGIAPYASTQMTADHIPGPVAERIAPANVAPVVSWLASSDCPASGEVLICGGGQVARAGMVTSEFVATPTTSDSDWEQVLTTRLSMQYPNAVEHFKAFVAGLEDPQ